MGQERPLLIINGRERGKRNAVRYDKNKELRAWLVDTPMCHVFLPPYSFNLNRIKRCGKYLRQQIITAPCYRTKGQFRTAVFDFFDRLLGFGPDLASLPTHKGYILNSQTAS